MAHWFETQYSQFKRVLPLLENRDIKVVWTISHEMFGSLSKPIENHQADEMIQTFYLDIFDYFEYLSIGFDNSDIFDNLLLKYLNSNFILFVREQIQSSFKGLLNRDLILKTEVEIGSSKTVDYQGYLDEYPDYFDYRFISGQGLSNAMFYIYRKNGHLACVELESDYLRESQQKSAKEVLRVEKEAQLKFYENSKKEKLFEKILKLFKEYHIDLIVNIYYDAPYHYTEKSSKVFFNKMSSVEKRVREYGFKAVSISPDKMLDRDFFDSNHLNAKGSKKYSKLLSKEIKDAI
jgi:hypothetical protein